MGVGAGSKFRLQARRLFRCLAFHAIDYARDFDRWEASGVEGYLGKYGYSIEVDEAWLEKANETMRLPGAAYSYGKGGSVTLVDPEGGRVYFFYAG